VVEDEQDELDERGFVDRLTCLNFVICDCAHACPATRKISYLGVIGEIGIPRVPFTLPQIAIAFTVVGPEGEYKLSMKIEHEQRASERTFDLPGHFIKVRDSETPVHQCINLAKMEVKEPGVYWFKLYADEKFIGQRPIWVRLGKPPPESPRQIK
jgi:hypothetical protein